MGVAKVYPHSKVHGPLKYSIQRRIRSNAPVLLIMGATCCTLLWLGQLLGQLLSPLPRPLPAMPHSPREIVQHSYHAIIVPAGGQLDVDGPPPHVAARLELAAKLRPDRAVGINGKLWIRPISAGRPVIAREVLVP